MNEVFSEYLQAICNRQDVEKAKLLQRIPNLREACEDLDGDKYPDLIHRIEEHVELTPEERDELLFCYVMGRHRER